MSKMPAKKKSCFQITSVTQAHQGPGEPTDDTESLDDPDESRTEEPSEIYEASRAEYEPAGERRSSVEALNNVGEAEAHLNAPQASQQSGEELRKVDSVHGGQQQQPSAPANTGSCTSRFRVIKLDHGTGEPFRRGRWTCTEFYEKDSETSHHARTDSLRHSSVTLDPVGERDSGLGPSVGSAATHSGPGLGSAAEGSHSSVPQQHVSGVPATHSSFSSVKPGAVPPQSSMGGLQPHPAQNVLPVGQNDLLHSDFLLQKSPTMPPSYPPQQPVPGVHPAGSQAEFYQQPASVPPGQSLPVVGQFPAPVLPSASSGSQVGDVRPAAPQAAEFRAPMLVGGSTPPSQQQNTVQYPPAGQPHPTSAGVLNVPAVNAGSSAPTSAPSASTATVPNATASSLPPGLIATSNTPGALGPTSGVLEAGGGRKSEGGVIPQSPVIPGRKAGKPLMPKDLQLTSPVTSPLLFEIPIPVDGDEDRNPSMAFYQAFQSGSRLRDSKAHSDSASGANIVAIDNKIEQAMDLVKSHLMYAVREEVEVLKEQIKELFERNSVLERENAVLKSLANSEQLSQLSAQTGAAAAAAAAATAATPGSASSLPQIHPIPQQLQTQIDASQQPQPNVTSA